MGFEDAFRRHIERSLVDRDWEVLECNPDLSAVRLWLYSVSLVTGPRVGGQVNSGFYRDMSTGGGVFARAQATGLSPAELLGNAILLFDEADQARRRMLGQTFLALLGNYARTTPTWRSLPPLSEVEGIHFYVIDWFEQEGSLILRPAVQFTKEVPTHEEMVGVLATVMAVHLARFPDQAPEGFEV